jgi:hypothetical protein
MAGVVGALEDFRRIVVDVRNMRAGNGDVAGGYLTALDLLERRRYPGEITLLADEGALRILGAMRGGDVLLGKRIPVGPGALRVHTVDSLPRDFGTADLYLSVARPSAARLHMLAQGTTVGGVRIGPETGHAAELVDSATVRIAQTVFGNTNDDHLARPNANLWIGDGRFEVSPAGVAPHEAGIYADPVALGLRGKSPREVREFLGEALDGLPSEHARESLRSLVEDRALRGAKRGLVYGVTLKEGRDQFGGYLRRAVSEARSNGESYAFVTPSRYRPEHLPAGLAGQVRFVSVSAGETLPAVAEPGIVYLIETPTLPHAVFVGLMADSELPVVVSGDSSLAAAIALGRPFAMTQLDWNKRTVAAVGKHLRGVSEVPSWDVLSRVFGGDALERLPDLSAAFELGAEALAPAFRALLGRAGLFTDQLIDSALRAKRGAYPGAAFETADRGLRTSLLIHGAAGGDTGAGRLLAQFLERNPERALGLLVTNVLGADALKDDAVRRALAGVMKAHASGDVAAFGRLLEREPSRALPALAREDVRLFFANPKNGLPGDLLN